MRKFSSHPRHRHDTPKRMTPNNLLHRTDFSTPHDAWVIPPTETHGVEIGQEGVVLAPAPQETSLLRGSGVHTRNGDQIELRFRVLEPGAGWLRFGFDADLHEHARVEYDLTNDSVSLSTSDWRLPQPLATAKVPAPTAAASHTLLIEKTEAGGDLIKNSDLSVYLEGEQILRCEDLDLLPEMGVALEVSGTRVLLEEFCHRGQPSGVPEYLNLGGYQVLNIDSIEANLESIKRGLRLAAEAGVELLATPEMSLTGLFPTSQGMSDPGPVAEAEAALQRFIHDLPGAPFTIVGLPVWKEEPNHGVSKTRYIASRVYNPDGEFVYTALKVQSAEQQTWHGYRLNEFDVNGVPVSLHICHDQRYPELQTLPVMFGCRLLLHPSNGGQVSGEVSHLEGQASTATNQTHAFYMNLNAGGGSFIAGPQTKGNLITVSDECRRDNPNAPAVDDPRECLMQARIRVHDAFGYWPMRSFRTSESVASSYLDFYRTLGGENF